MDQRAAGLTRNIDKQAHTMKVRSHNTDSYALGIRYPGDPNSLKWVLFTHVRPQRICFFPVYLDPKG